MDLLSPQQMFFGSAAQAVYYDKNYAVYKMKDKSGEGTMTCYLVYPGIYLIYNNFHMESCCSKCMPRQNVLEVNHCRRGRIECEFENGSYIYIEEGDFIIASKDTFFTASSFPLDYYHGISVAIDVAEAAQTLSSVFNCESINLEELKEKLYRSNKYYILRGNERIAHIFSELYTVPDVVKKDYYRVKVLELLLFLKTVDIIKESEERPYYLKNQVDIVKEIMRFMTKHMDRHFTLPELSSKFNISLTTMKCCFKGVYGTSIYAYMRTFRMQSAAVMLKETRYSVMEIAGKVGYSNASKFAAAFRDVMGLTPLEYRKFAV